MRPRRSQPGPQVDETREESLVSDTKPGPAKAGLAF